MKLLKVTELAYSDQEKCYKERREVFINADMIIMVSEDYPGRTVIDLKDDFQIICSERAEEIAECLS